MEPELIWGERQSDQPSAPRDPNDDDSVSQTSSDFEFGETDDSFAFDVEAPKQPAADDLEWLTSLDRHPEKFIDYIKYANLKILTARNLDGSENNKDYVDWGSAGTKLSRMTPSSYDDASGTAADPRANYRALSNDVIKQDGEIANSNGVSDLFTFFGQFVDHDIDLSGEGHEEGPYVIAPADDIFGFAGKKLGIDRSEPYGSGKYGHANAITSFVDASNVYGSDDATMSGLRDGEKPWLLAMSVEGKLLPLTGDGPRDQFYAGDVRAGENSALTSLHTIWALEHNRQADALKELFPSWSYDEVFHAAKVKVEALMQHVVFNEWLPALVGQENIPEYKGYDAGVDATIAQEFAHGAFRFGHSMLSSKMLRMDEAGNSTGDLNLADMFFNAAILKHEGSVDTLVRGIASHTAQEIDHKLVEDVRSMLFPAGGELQARDLSVLNLLRGIDHGLGTINEVRDALGLDTYDDFIDLTGGDAGLAAALDDHYTSVNDVDLWIGGLIEDKAPGSQLGETFHTIVVDQFMRLRDGDAYFFEERLKDNPWLLEEVRSTKFSDIIKANTEIDYLQQDVFYAHQRHGGDNGNNNMMGTDGRDLMIGFAGKDTLNGSLGDDEMYGGKGRDMFVFDIGTGHDRVGDFEKGKDKLDISNLVWDGERNNSFDMEIENGNLTLNFESGDKIELLGVKHIGWNSLILNNDEHDSYGV
ncbi:MAG: peroxidase family protein [Hyphomicrobiaceae bacterium]